LFPSTRILGGDCCIFDEDFIQWYNVLMIMLLMNKKKKKKKIDVAVSLSVYI